MIDRTALLDALKPVLLHLEKDLRARSDAEPTIKAKLTAQYEAARASRRTAEAYSVWRDELVTQIAVAWVLGTVFIRFLEDNELLDHSWISGPGDRRTAAEHEREEYFRTNKLHSDRDYLEHVFRTAAGLPGLSHLFDPKHNPLWQFGPTGDAVTKLLRFWQERNPDTGVLKHDFTDASGDTRFLGDLYQDLSEAARKRYALLQTPLFIEEFILDRTLDPAIQAFGLKGIRMIDPTCGSGHFVLGGFDRILKRWQQAEPATPIRELAQRALDSVFGVDLNPFAVGIARFRLLIAALRSVGVTKVKGAPNFRLNLANGDSLLHGRRFREFESNTGPQRTFDTGEAIFRDELKHHYEVEDVEALHRILGQQYHAVVGNPPYIAVKDRAVSELYRARFPSCSGKYSLSVPFMERFFDLAVKGGGTPQQPAGIVGQITSNSFMKREFGKKLIEEYLPRWDLTHVLDTAGAYIPGHGTPTVILFGKNQPPVSGTIRTVLGIAGEPTIPDDPAHGLVWQAIIRQIDEPGSVSEWMSAANSPRANFYRHPWSIGGGGAAELKEQIDETAHTKLGCLAEQIGITSVTGEDDVYAMAGIESARRLQIEFTKPLVEGDIVRDWTLGRPLTSIWLYDDDFKLLSLAQVPKSARLLWSAKALISHRKRFGTPMLERGLSWYEWQELYDDKLRTSLSIVFAFVATHNHFLLDRGGRVFKQSAPVIKMPIGTTEDQLLALVGILNSSTACFWLKQVCQPKATSVGDISKEKGRAEANRYEFTSTVLLSFPIPDLNSDLAKRVRDLARALDQSASELLETKPSFVIRTWAAKTESRSDINTLIATAKSRRQKIRAHMILLQEELDWVVYKLFELAPSTALDLRYVLESSPGIELSWRPFAWGDGIAPSAMSQQLQTAFLARRKIIEGDQKVRTIESPLYKRPWLGRQGVYGSGIKTYEEEIHLDLSSWLLDRIERAIGRDLSAPEGSDATNAYQPKVDLLTTQEITDLVSQADFREAAETYRGRADFDPSALVAELIRGAAVPFLPGQRYKESGLRKRAVWEDTWDKQRAEDAIDDQVGLNTPNLTNAERKRLEAEARKLKIERIGEIPVPPKYASADFRASTYWSLRGKLDVPKERFISYPGCSRDGDPCLTVAWAGLDHLQLAKALAAHYGNLQATGAGEPKLLLVLAGLNELLPWLKQWHNQLDPEFGLKMGDYYEEYVREEAKRFGKSLSDLKQIAMTP